VTTIAAKGGMVAADSQITGNGGSRKGRVRKLVRLSDGSIFGGAGNYCAVRRLFQWADTGFEGKRPPKTQDAECLLIRADKSVWCLDGQGDPYEVEGDFHAIGSGGDYALGAMAMGADPLKAVRVAAEFDPMTSGPFQSERLVATRKRKK
jgi:ATP-dependent protease HslVU (ClpYQ) peptidase subunit